MGNKQLNIDEILAVYGITADEWNDPRLNELREAEKAAHLEREALAEKLVERAHAIAAKLSQETGVPIAANTEPIL